ncbi:hypothetical protein DSECCO2_550080 [anaerobic digester metagenome]
MAVDLKAELSKTCIIEPALYYLKCSHLFTHKEYTFTLSKQFCNRVCNCLRLSRTRRSLNNKIFSGFNILNDCYLGRVGIHYIVGIFCRKFKVNFLFSKALDLTFGFLGIEDFLNKRVLCRGHVLRPGRRVKILIHDEFSEVKKVKADFRKYLPFRFFADCCKRRTEVLPYP